MRGSDGNASTGGRGVLKNAPSPRPPSPKTSGTARLPLVAVGPRLRSEMLRQIACPFFQVTPRDMVILMFGDADNETGLL